MTDPHQTASGSRTFHRRMVWVLIVLLVIAHHDFWWWGSGELVLGFLPIGLAYHMLFSLAAGALWVYAIFCAWPTELEAWADAEQSAGDAQAEARAQLNASRVDGGETR